MIVEIDDVDDPRLTDYASLNSVETRREVERRGSFFIAESELVIRELVATRDRWPIRSVLVTPKRFEAMADVLDPLAAGVDGDPPVPVFVGPMDVVRAVTGFHIHRGAVASAERGALASPADVASGGNRADGDDRSRAPLVVLQGVADHENIGSIFRSAAAFGARGVLLDPRCADPLYRRSVRVSMGHVLRVPFGRIAALDDLRSADPDGLVIALTPAADAVGLESLVVDPDRPVTIVLGAEGPGLTDDWLRDADVRARIDIAPGVDSLNVAVAAAVALHQLWAQGRR